MYAYVRTYTRTRRIFSDNKSALQHYQIEFNHQSNIIRFYYPITIQSISILAPHWLRHLYKLSSYTINYHPSASIFQLSTNHLIIFRSSPIHYHHLPSSQQTHPHIIFYLYPITSPTHHPINILVCYKTLSILYIFLTPICSSLSSYTDYWLHQPNYNHFHYRNRIPR